MNECKAILLASTTAAEAVNGLFTLKKTQNAKFSTAYFAKRIGLSSRTNFSDVLRGRRQLPRKHVAALCKEFGLNEAESDFLKCLIERDRARERPAKERAEAVLVVARRKMRFEIRRQPREDPSIFTTKVYASLGFRNGKGSLEELEKFFGSSYRSEIIDSLRSLEKAGMIRFVDGQFEHFTAEVGITMFTDAQMMKDVLRDSGEQVDEFYSRPEDSCLRSLVFSAKKSVYLATVKKIREQYLENVLNLDSDEGDMIVTYNLQLIPTFPASKAD